MQKRLHKMGLTLPDLFALALILAGFAGVLFVARYWTGPLRQAEPVDLSLHSLPYATFLSCSRILLAYIICLVSSIGVGYWAAHSRFAENIIVPLIDIGQSIPVLGFLPGLVLSFIALFPESRVGLEIAAIFTLYTGMAWNLMLSFYGSIKTIPREYVEIIRAYGYGPLGTLLRLELPYSMNGLIWNSMLSVAGGWFFLTVCESYTLGEKSFNLVGLGSYMSAAADRGDYVAILAGGLVMVLILIVTDFFIWNPLLRWAERFQRMRPITDEEEESKVITFFTQSKRITNFIRKIRRRYAGKFFVHKGARRGRRGTSNDGWVRHAGWAAFIVLLLFTAWGLYAGGHMLSEIPRTEWILIGMNTLYTLARVSVVCIASTAIMVPFGLWLGSRPKLVQKTQSVIQVIAAFPAPMLFPLFIHMFLSVGVPFSIGSIVLMMTGAQWYLLFNTISGAASVPEALVEVAEISGMNPLNVMKRVYLPAAFPQILTGLITAAGGAWNVSIVAELVSFRGQEFIAPGLGSYLAKSAYHAKYPELVAAVSMMVVVIVLLNRFFWARLYNLAESRYRLDG